MKPRQPHVRKVPTWASICSNNKRMRCQRSNPLIYEADLFCLRLKRSLRLERKEEKDGWVPRRYVREDIKRTIDMRRYRNLFVSLVRVDGTGKQENKNACETWYSFGNANLASTDICPQTNGRWHVQVGSGVLDWEYPDDGLVGDIYLWKPN